MSILEAPYIPNPPLTDRSASAIVTRRLRRQLAVYEGSMKLPFVPGSLGMTPTSVGIGTAVAPEGITMADRFNSLSNYMRAGANILTFGFEFDVVIEDIRRKESIDFERLTVKEHCAVRAEENRLVAELTAERCRKGL